MRKETKKQKIANLEAGLKRVENKCKIYLGGVWGERGRFDELVDYLELRYVATRTKGYEKQKINKKK